ncbi:MAG: OadG family protein [Lachnospiraceae bacterium]|nr:OadG family protein [Lachnospiraceae bacterium]
MKRTVSLVCVLACVLVLTACGSSDTVSEYQANKLANAETIATDSIIPLIEACAATDEIMDIIDADGYTYEEWENDVYVAFGLYVDGEAFVSAINSYAGSIEEMGEIVSIGDVTSSVDDDQIIIYVDVVGTERTGQFEIIVSNDYFAELVSCSLNVDYTMGEKISKAAMNTVLGIGMVFLVLVIIMAIISLFKYIPMLQEKFSRKPETSSEPAGPAAAPAAPVEVYEEEEETDDTELVAVIAAAVAAYEGQTSTDGFVVRSIRRAKRY